MSRCWLLMLLHLGVAVVDFQAQGVEGGGKQAAVSAGFIPRPIHAIRRSPLGIDEHVADDVIPCFPAFPTNLKHRHGIVIHVVSIAGVLRWHLVGHDRVG